MYAAMRVNTHLSNALYQITAVWFKHEQLVITIIIDIVFIVEEESVSPSFEKHRMTSSTVRLNVGGKVFNFLFIYFLTSKNGLKRAGFPCILAASLTGAGVQIRLVLFSIHFYFLSHQYFRKNCSMYNWSGDYCILWSLQLCYQWNVFQPEI